MLLIKEKGLLLRIINHCQRIEDAVKRTSKEEFLTNTLYQDCISFNLLQIGELAKKFDPNFIKEYGNAPWKKIKGMRDVLVHGYGTVVFSKIWDTATKDIVPLHEYCLKIIENNPILS